MPPVPLAHSTDPNVTDNVTDDLEENLGKTVFVTVSPIKRGLPLPLLLLLVIIIPPTDFTLCLMVPALTANNAK